ncbi:unnamed protein product [Scytosiphon promiscuus]
MAYLVVSGHHNRDGAATVQLSPTLFHTQPTFDPASPHTAVHVSPPRNAHNPRQAKGPGDLWVELWEQPWVVTIRRASQRSSAMYLTEALDRPTSNCKLRSLIGRRRTKKKSIHHGLFSEVHGRSSFLSKKPPSVKRHPLTVKASRYKYEPETRNSRGGASSYHGQTV